MRRCWFVWVALGACGDNAPVMDDPADVPSIEAQTSLTIVEGETDALAIRLVAPSGEPVVVRVTSTNPGAVVVTPPEVTLDATTTAAVVSVTSSEDDENVIDETAEIVLAIDRGAVRRVMTRVIDNDVQQIVATAIDLEVRESETETFGIRLARKPSAPVTVTVWSDAPTIATATPTVVTFDPSSYDVAVEITVEGLQDLNLANGVAHIYAGQLQNVSDARIDVDVLDDDEQALVLDATNVPVAEGGTAVFAVRLAFEPLQPTAVELQSNVPTSAAVTSPLQFDNTNYSVPQTITVTALEDANAVNEAATIALTGAASATIDVPVTDNDLLLVQASSVYEGQTSSFYVRLADTLPAPLPVTVEVLGGDVTVSPGSFFVADTLISSAFEVTATLDSNTNAERSALIRISAPGQTARDVPITIRDVLPGTLLVHFIAQENVVTGMEGHLRFRFTPQHGWPGDGRFVVTFPPGFDAANASFELSSVDGSYAITSTTSTLTIIRSGGTPIYGDIELRVGGIRNAPVSGSYSIGLATQTSTGSLVDRATYAIQIFPSPMPHATATLGSTQPGASTSLTFDFTTRNPWPGDGRLEIYVPNVLGIANATVSSVSGIDGTVAVSVAGPYITLTRGGGTTAPGGTRVLLTVAPINNPTTSQSTPEFQLTTQTGSGASIDVAVVRGVVVGCPSSITKLPSRASSVPFGGMTWQNPDGVTGLTWGSDVAYIYSLTQSDYLVASNFLFALPQGASVTGISFEIGRDAPGLDAVDRAVRIVRASIGDADRASATAWGDATSPATYGSSTDLWDETWSASDIESNSFGVALAVQALPPNATAYYVRVGYVTATVYLSCP